MDVRCDGGLSVLGNAKVRSGGAEAACSAGGRGISDAGRGLGDVSADWGAASLVSGEVGSGIVSSSVGGGIEIGAVVVGTGSSGVAARDEASGAPQGVVKSVSLGDSTSVRPERDCERPGWQSLASCGPVKVRWMEDARMGEVAVALLSLVDLTGVLSVSLSDSFARARRRLSVSSLSSFVSTEKALVDMRQRGPFNESNHEQQFSKQVCRAQRNSKLLSRDPRPNTGALAASQGVLQNYGSEGI